MASIQTADFAATPLALSMDREVEALRKRLLAAVILLF